MGYLYILYSAKLDRYYIGSTSDIKRRFLEHQRGQTSSTAKGVPWELVFCKDYNCHAEAAFMEIKLKSWKSRRIIEDIVKNGKMVG